MAYSGSLTLFELSRLARRIFAENDVFKIGKRRLAQIFLRRLMESTGEVSDAEVEKAYRASSKDEIPEGAQRFWQYIETTYLHLEIEPREKFVEIAFQVSEDLRKIGENLAYISQEKQNLEQKKRDSRLSPEERYYRNQLNYFDNKNVVARNEIIDFMANGIKPHAISKASTRMALEVPFFRIFGDIPYAFGRARGSYDVRSLDEYSNKFLDLPVTNYRALIDQCKRSTEEFKNIAREYLAGVPNQLPSIRDKLQKLIDSSHILAQRKQVFEVLLKHFEAGDYISFINIAPLQIEGIFADVCREIGVSENQLDISSLNDKLEHIDGKIGSFYYFEYYAFKFPVLRNLVAHGGLLDGDLENTALQLMLDLLPVCDLTLSEELPVNHALSVMGAAADKQYDKLVEWLDIREKVTIPDFYDASAKISEIESLYLTQEFWAFLEQDLKQLRSTDEIGKCKSVKAAGMLKRNKLAATQAEEFLKSANRVVSESVAKREEQRATIFKLLNKAE